MQEFKVLSKVVVAIASATDTELVKAQPNKKIRVWALVLQNKHATVDTNITFKSATTAISGVLYMKALGTNGFLNLPYTSVAYYSTAKGEALNVTTSGAGDLNGEIYFTYED